MTDTPNALVEAVARAIHDAPWGDTFQTYAHPAARAAIAAVLDAMETPSEGMVKAAFVADYAFEAEWRAMIAQFRKESLT